MSGHRASNDPERGRLWDVLARWADLVIAANTVYPDGVIVSWMDTDERGMPALARRYFKGGREEHLHLASPETPKMTHVQLLHEWKAATSVLSGTRPH